MVNIFLCDDEQALLDRYEQIVTDYMKTKKRVGQVFFKARNGYDLLILLQESGNQGGVYFLDIDLANDELNGIDLAVKIRELDPYAQIAFISIHDELLMEMIGSRVSVLNFIFKDNGLTQVTADIQATLDSAIKFRDQQVPEEVPTYFEYDNGLMFEKVNIDEINYFETAHKTRYLILHRDSSLIEFSGRMLDIEAQLPNFLKVHKSILVNPDKVVRIDKEAHQAIFDNGDTCDVAYRKIDELVKVVYHPQC
ncbi:LytR/AlgR family response regulator transcription factor [Latilactobacillus graminis]|uniref:LytTr DNA-binding domain protein n=2 Tax=Latilactobacillus graminis TaxID=60519 RepID=A0AA89I734_9LACO|nr:LytTR family DNA-binding domain-containing protein [Latilactobacillus graminis]KRM22307.1 lytTr DNA-binding domain protein [Latilactobacillus graminis DSM 20719]QFP79518.1 response regulator transcription factor [Latilactobacillus graminis]